jgi:hypothetical protein
MDTVAQCTSLAPQILGFIFFELFSNLGRTGCRRGRTPERPLRQPSQGLADPAGPFVCSCSRIARMESAYFVVARRGKAPPLPPPQHGGRAISDARS